MAANAAGAFGCPGQPGVWDAFWLLTAPRREKKEEKNIAEKAVNRRTRTLEFLDCFKHTYKKSTIPLNNIPEIPPTDAITPDLAIMDSLIMEDEHLRTIPETESNKLIKSSVENLVPIPNPHHFNAESDLIESLLNRYISMVSYPKIDYLLEEFSGELTHINLIPSGIKEANLDPEEEICLIEEFLYDNLSPRPPKESNYEISDATIESFSPSPIPVEDSDSLMEEIDLFLNPDDSIPPGIENDDYDSEGDILFLEELLSNDSLSLPDTESFHFDHYDVPSSPPPPAKPPDDGIFFNFEPDTGVLTAKVGKFTSDFSESPMMISGGNIPLLDDCPDYEDSRARGFVHHPLDLQSLACLYGNPIS
ncbi:hypothetical protein Tco_1233997 [Tanacetum coccineum]